MSTPEQLAAQAEAVAAVRVARIGRDNATDGLRAAILAAIATGASVRNVALAAGVTPQRVYQMLGEDR